MIQVYFYEKDSIFQTVLFTPDLLVLVDLFNRKNVQVNNVFINGKLVYNNSKAEKPFTIEIENIETKIV